MHGRALLFILLLSPCAHARDLSVFNLLRLDMPAADSTPAPREGWVIDTQLGYQNTWSMSPNVQDYFETAHVRRQLSAADIAEIRALPYEKFLVDLEMGVVDVAVRRKLDARWSAYGIVSAVTYSGGFMDAAIERFHSALGFREYVRGAVPRNHVTVIADVKGTDYVLQSAPSGGLLDPVLGVRYDAGTFALDAAVKVPVAGKRAFLSNGNADVGVQATVRRALGSHSGYASLAGVFTKGGGILETRGHYFVPTAAAGYEYAFGQGTSLLLQGNVSRYALDSGDTDIGGLRQPKVQATAGLRHRAGHSVFTFAVSEGFGAYNGLPDLGLQLGWTLDN